MMRKKAIGILGYRGLVGNEAVNVLSKNDNYKLKLGSRRSQKDIISKEKYENISYHQIDIYDKHKLQSFCEDCDLIINCTGPSSKILSTVAEICIDKGVTYVNPSGDKAMIKKVETYQKTKPLCSTCIFSAGIYPGLTEIFIDYIAQKIFDEIKTIKLYLAGISSFSKNGSYDVISSLENDEGVGIAFCKKGNIKKITSGFGSKTLLPKPIGQVNVIPFISDEFLRVVRHNKIEEAYFYNTFNNDEMMSQFVMIKASGQYKTETQKCASAEKLINVYNKNRNQNDCVMLHAVSTGRKEGTTMEIHSTLTCHKDWNKLSGTIAGIVADEILCKNKMERGSYFVHEIVSSKKVFERFLQQEGEIFHKEKALPF